MLTIKNSEGVSDCICSGDHHLLAYDSNGYRFHGVKHGRTTLVGTIEYFATAHEVIDRAAEIGIVIPTDREADLENT